MIGSRAENINILQEVYRKQERKPVAVFIGAGVSAPLGISLWEDLLVDMNNFFLTNLSADDVKKSIKGDGYAKTASLIFKKKEDLDLYKRFMKEKVIPRKGYCSSIYDSLFLYFNQILTTNYDISLFKSFQKKDEIIITQGGSPKNYSKQELSRLDPIELANPVIAYLHGNTEYQEYVFREEEYYQNYPSFYNENQDTNLELFLKVVFRRYHLVFIGISFNDEHFVELMRTSRNEFKQEISNYQNLYERAQPHDDLPENFVFISEDELKTFISDKDVNDLEKDYPKIKELLIEDQQHWQFNPEFYSRINDIENNDAMKKIKENIEKNKERLQIFTDLGVRPISFKEDYFGEIEDVLASLSSSISYSNSNGEEAHVT